MKISTLVAIVFAGAWSFLSAHGEPAEPAAIDSSAYVFTYFVGNGEDGLHLLLSRDGLTWHPVNEGRAVFNAQVGSQRLMRDPCAIRGPDGRFHLVWTTGWKGLDIGYAHSPDLIHWGGHKCIAISRPGMWDSARVGAGGAPIRYADAVVIAADGRMYFTDATRRFSPRELGTFDASVLDILEHSCTGRVLVYETAAARASLVVGGLCFPNGVALSGDERHLFIAETGEYRIWKVAVAARGLDARSALASGYARARVIASNLPGFPDNLTRSADGRLWTGLTKPRAAAIDRMASTPWLRSLTLRLPKTLWPVPPTYGHVIAFDEDGRVVSDLQDPAGRLAETSGVTEHGGRLYVHSLHAPAFGILDAAAAGLPAAGSPEDLEAVQGPAQQ